MTTKDLHRHHDGAEVALTVALSGAAGSLLLGGLFAGMASALGPLVSSRGVWIAILGAALGLSFGADLGCHLLRRRRHSLRVPLTLCVIALLATGCAAWWQDGTFERVGHWGRVFVLWLPAATFVTARRYFWFWRDRP